MSLPTKLHHFCLQFQLPMAAYAALLALARSLQDILDLEQYIDPLHKPKIISLHEKVDFIVTSLEKYSDKHHGKLDCVGNGIRKAAFEAQDFMDSCYYSLSTTTDDDDDGSSSSEANGDEVNLDRGLTMASERIDFIWEETMKMNNSTDTSQDLPSEYYSYPVDRSSTAQNLVVGFDDDLKAIEERLYEDSAKLRIIPIVGMGGMGKTTLARRAYEDSILSQYFDKCAWITVSQEYQRREILSGLLKSLKNEQSADKSEAELAILAYQNLIGRQYLIVVDDIWSTKAWDDLKMIFPDDGNGSRILLTSRILEVAANAGSSDTLVHQMSFLNEDLSWKLLQERVFRQESCPLHLVEVGKKIAKNCGGLPLTIVVVAGLLLSSADVMKEQVWENISENISSREPTIALQCSKILCFSYDRLPLRLKPCFLYFAAFSEDSEIDVSKLIRLWVADGFLKPKDPFKRLEDVGEHYLEDLVKRNLVLAREKGPDGKLKTVGIHDMLREICITKAEEEGFLHQVSTKINKFRTEFIENPYRRFKIHSIKRCDELNIEDLSVRSILFGESGLSLPKLYVRSRHVCILDAPRVLSDNISHLYSTFVNLRYFAFFLDFRHSSHPELPVSISKHPNLETIIVRAMKSEVVFSVLLEIPYEILKMRKLRHLICHNRFRFSTYPFYIGIVHESGLQTIETVIDFVFTEEITRILVNLKKLKVEYDMENRHWKWDHFNLYNLFDLRNLEDLQISMFLPRLFSMTWNHAFPMGLKKLSLDGVPFPWDNMTIIGSLPNLQVLEMINIELTRPFEWRTEEGEFLQLKYFHSSLNHVRKWETEKDHFPCLESLILDYVIWIDKIPSGLEEIDSLQYIELKNCIQSLVDSAEQIQKNQHENGNDGFRVRVIYE
ncbi:putative late blight resistance protein homolog R1A-3 [Henckelia pumila]|uniref:putative late blight resistance protein homolog R1A-3 n=1 Tax=Henckelia pumila TaxID=405737 RepID=UPI003C6E8B84